MAESIRESESKRTWFVSPTLRLSKAAVPMLAAAQVLWLGWFLTSPLPNATPVGANQAVTRGLLLFSTTPGLNPGFTWQESLIGQALEELAGFPRLIDRLPVLATGSAILAAILGLGTVVRNVLLKSSNDWLRGERLLAAVSIGFPAWGSMTLILGRLGILNRGIWFAIVGAFAGLFLWDCLKSLSGRAFGKSAEAVTSVSRFGCDFLPWPAWPFVTILLLASMLPTIDFDCIEYHLQGPKEYYQNGRISYLGHNIYTNMPFGVEMLHLTGMVVSDDWKTGALAGQLLIATHALVAAAAIVAIARRIDIPQAGWWAALFYLSAPWTYRVAAIPYVEGPLCAAMAAWIWAVERAWREGTIRSWILVGVVSGWAMSCKYTAILPVVVPGAVVMLLAIIRQRNPKPIVGTIVGGSLIFGPWLCKNVVDTGNPVYPLAWSVFGGIDRNAEDDAKWSRAHGPKPLEFGDLRKSIVDVAGRNDWQTPLFMAFVPLVLAIRGESRKAVAILSLLAIWIFASWWIFTHRLDRFWLPIQPVLAILAGVGAAVLCQLAGGRFWGGLFVGICLFANWIYCSTALAGLNEWTTPLDRLWKSVPERLYPASVAVDRAMTASDKALLVGQAAVFYWERPILYNTVFDHERIETLAKGKSSGQIADALAESGITIIFVDWPEIKRYRSPGNYGFTDFVTREFFDGLVRDGVLSRPDGIWPSKQIYRVLR